MNYTKYDAMDLASTAATMGMLYAVSSPWWAYVGVLAFGTVQRIIGKRTAA